MTGQEGASGAKKRSNTQYTLQGVREKTAHTRGCDYKGENLCSTTTRRAPIKPVLQKARKSPHHRAGRGGRANLREGQQIRVLVKSDATDRRHWRRQENPSDRPGNLERGNRNGKGKKVERVKRKEQGTKEGCDRQKAELND